MSGMATGSTHSKRCTEGTLLPSILWAATHVVAIGDATMLDGMYLHCHNTRVIWDAKAAGTKLPTMPQHAVASSMQTLLATKSLQLRSTHLGILPTSTWLLSADVAHADRRGVE